MSCYITAPVYNMLPSGFHSILQVLLVTRHLPLFPVIWIFPQLMQVLYAPLSPALCEAVSGYRAGGCQGKASTKEQQSAPGLPPLHRLPVHKCVWRGGVHLTYKETSSKKVKVIGAFLVGEVGGSYFSTLGSCLMV